MATSNFRSWTDNVDRAGRIAALAQPYNVGRFTDAAAISVAFLIMLYMRHNVNNIQVGFPLPLQAGVSSPLTLPSLPP